MCFEIEKNEVLTFFCTYAKFITMEKYLSPTKIFNEFGERNIDARRIIGGNTTNIMELNNLKYSWAYDLYRTMGFTNFWIPEEISMNDDKYFVHYNSDVIKLQITPKLFYVPVKFIPNELKGDKIVQFYMHEVHPKCVLKLRKTKF